MNVLALAAVNDPEIVGQFTRIGTWTVGLVLVLACFWMLLGFLGWRLQPFGRRLLAGAVLVVASSLWLGMHPSWGVDAGYLAQVGYRGLAENEALSNWVKNCIAAFLVCSSVGALLIATDWLPLRVLLPRLEGGRAALRPARRRARGGGELLPAGSSLRARAETRGEPTPPSTSGTRTAATVAVAESDLERGAGTLDAVEEETSWERVADDAEARSAQNTDEAPLTERPAEGVSADREEASPWATAEEEAAAAWDAEVAEPDAANAALDEAMAVEPATNWNRFRSAPASEDQWESDLDDTGTDDSEADETATDDIAIDDDADEVTTADEVVLGAGAVAAPDSVVEPAEFEPAEAAECADDDDDGWDDDYDYDDDDEEGDDKADEDEEEDDEEEDEDDEDWDEDEDEDEDEDWDDEEDEDEDEEDEDEEWEEDEEDEEDYDDDEARRQVEIDAGDAMPEEVEAAPTVTEEVSPFPSRPTPPRRRRSGQSRNRRSWRTSPRRRGRSPTQRPGSRTVPEPRPTREELPAEPHQELADEVGAAPEVELAVDDEVQEASEDQLEEVDGLVMQVSDEEREVFVAAVRVLLQHETMSLPRLQRELGVTYFTAARMFEYLEKGGLVSAYDGSLARTVLLDRPLWESWMRQRI